jgi:ABC-type uncharacterized transport system permease subunit
MLQKTLIVLFLLSCLAGAEMPKVGDEVSITQSIGVMERLTVGKMVAIDSDFITLNMSTIYQRSGFLDWHPVYRGNGTIVLIALPTISAMTYDSYPLK